MAEARARPWAPNILMYIQEMGRINEEPYGAAATAESAPLESPVDGSTGNTECPGKNGARCAFTPMAPTPGPPPPCGMQNVLCMFRWQTSAPQVPGDVRPHWAFKFAPSIYTWPPHSCVMRVKSVMVSSKTPYVDGYVTMIADKLSLCFSALALKSSRSMLPSSSDLTMTHLRPAITAEAGFVPWADTGMRQTFRWPSPMDCWYARIARRPAYSPEAPLLGWTETASKPVILHKSAFNDAIISTYPSVCSRGANG